MKRTAMARGTGFRRPALTREPLPAPRPITRGVAVSCAEMSVAQPKPVEYRNPSLLAMARDKRCLLRVRGICNSDVSTTVAAHSNWAEHGKGGARKADDQYTVWACSSCHTWLDSGKAAKAIKQAAFMRAHLDQVLAWRRIVGDISNTPKERKAAQWALCLLKSEPNPLMALDTPPQ